MSILVLPSSPRGGQALALGSKVTALMAGRYNVALEDVHAAARAALRHRLLLNFDGLAEGIRADTVIDEFVGSLQIKSCPPSRPSPIRKPRMGEGECSVFMTTSILVQVSVISSPNCVLQLGEGREGV